jgi:arabinogalactan endo-1,4-beta-galactosidase
MSGDGAMQGVDSSMSPASDQEAGASPPDSGGNGTPPDAEPDADVVSSIDAGMVTDAGIAPMDSGEGVPFPFNPPYILGADISWETQHEAEGYTYSDGKSTKTMTAIMAENGFNFVRLRTFVDPSASDGYSPGQKWCGQSDTVTMAKRAKACGMGVFIDFHMSDTWESLGTNANASAMPLAWRGLSQTVPSTPVSASTHYTNNLYQTAHDYVAGVMQALVAAGAKPDMVQIGNETNTGMSGIPMSNSPAFSALVNAGIRAVRETDPRIIVWAQNGRPRPDSAGGSNFTGWVDDYLSGKAPHTPAIDEDGICGSTYGTTNAGADWTTSFDYVISTYDKPVMSCEYTDKSPDSPAGAIINGLMRAFPNHMGRGSFVWEPADYPSVNGSGTLFTLTGKVYTTNAAMTGYPTLAKSYGLPVPSGACQ